MQAYLETIVCKFGHDRGHLPGRRSDLRKSLQTDRRQTPRHCISSFLEWAKNTILFLYLYVYDTLCLCSCHLCVFIPETCRKLNANIRDVTIINFWNMRVGCHVTDDENHKFLFWSNKLHSWSCDWRTSHFNYYCTNMTLCSNSYTLSHCHTTEPLLYMWLNHYQPEARCADRQTHKRTMLKTISPSVRG